MHKDPNLVKRNSLVIPGGLLALLSVVGMVYVAGLRDDSGTCEDGSLIVLAGDCRPALLVLAIPLVIGLALVAVGALKFRSVTTCRLGHGSWAHFGLAALIAMVVVPALAALLAPALLGQSDPSLVRGNVAYPLRTILGGVSVIGLFALAPFAALYSARNRANPCCQEKGCFEPCFCDEPIEAPADGALAEPLAAPATTESVTAWEEAPAPVAPLEPAPAPEPVPQAEPVQETPGEWEVVPDEPEPAPAPAAAAPAQARSRAAPALATRPTDPAAPPQDQMAIAAKWAAEDEEAESELKGSDKPARQYRSGHSRGAPAKKAAKKSSKK